MINDLAIFLDPFHVKWFVSGGWAIDIHLNRVTRKRCDLDISVPYSERKTCIAFFLEQGWIIEGKLFGGFKPVKKLSDYNDDIHYFWGFPKGADFVSEYIDNERRRRISYNRDVQYELDYIEVFFDRVEDGYYQYFTKGFVVATFSRLLAERLKSLLRFRDLLIICFRKISGWSDMRNKPSWKGPAYDIWRQN